MFCKNCGYKLNDEDRFCQVCGTPVERETSVAPRAESGKSKILPAVIISVVAVILLAVGVTCFILTRHRSASKALDLYQEAINEKNEEKLLKAVLPKDYRDVLSEKVASESLDMIESMSYADTMEDVSIKDSEDLDSTTQDDFNQLLIRMNIDMVYDTIKSADISYTKDGVELTQKVIMYKVDKDWYVFPKVLEYMTKERQEKDIASAKEIYDALEGVMSDSGVYSDMSLLFGAVISLDSDMSYLPQSFQDKFAQQMSEIPAVQNRTCDGVGFSFEISSDGSDITVYMESSNSMNEWELYPQVSDRFETGEIDSSSSAQSSDYSVAKIISKESPISGYWQSSQAGMYIGYGVSGGDEGFAVYIQINNDDYGEFRLLHTLNNYDFECEDGGIKYVSNSSNSEGEYISLSVTDGEHIHVDAKLTYTGSDNEAYSLDFEKSEIPQEVFDQYVGEWVPSDLYSLGQLTWTSNLKITYNDGCLQTDCVSDGRYSNPYVVLYDGVNILHVIIPNKGLYLDEGWIGYSGEKYVVNGDELWYQEYIHGYGSSTEVQFIRKGSAGADIAEALNAYKAYIDGTLNPENRWDGYKLMYLDDDDIPELVALGTHKSVGNMICGYYDGNVYGYQLTGLNFSYIPKENLLCSSDNDTDYYYDVVYSMEKGELNAIAGGYHYGTDGDEQDSDDGGLSYCWNDSFVSEEEYYKQLNAVFNTDKSVSVYDLDSDTDLGSLWMRVKPSE
jgi:hypothetical protein